MPVRAVSTNTGISVKKVKPIIDLVRGKKVDDALLVLRFLTSPVAARVAKVVKSAASNAENELMARSSDLKIIEIYANEGPRLKRFRARARGRVARIIRRNSHITVVVDEEEGL
ncbi:MAG: 50S ribosomal protein L22 [Chloroflexi bacterium]|nr:50S ribosomal protein L22 [Chloroflexota bacterium]